MKEITRQIERKIAVLSEERGGWLLELNMVSWNGYPPKFDIRRWSPDHSQTSKGVTLNECEAGLLLEALRKELED